MYKLNLMMGSILGAYVALGAVVHNIFRHYRLLVGSITGEARLQLLTKILQKINVFWLLYFCIFILLVIIWIIFIKKVKLIPNN